jgi:hypothetical protein
MGQEENFLFAVDVARLAGFIDGLDVALSKIM